MGLHGVEGAVVATAGAPVVVVVVTTGGAAGVVVVVVVITGGPASVVDEDEVELAVVLAVDVELPVVVTVVDMTTWRAILETQ